MRRMWLAYLGVALLGALVGVAIAGIPSGNSNQPAELPVVTEPAPTSLVTMTVPDPSTTTSTPAATTSTTTTTTTTSPASTTAPTTTTTTTLPLLPDRGDIAVVAVNGANVAGLAGRTTDLLIELGYAQTRSTDGRIIAEITLIYFADGFVAEAQRLADDLALVDPQLLPIDDGVPFNVLEGDQLAVYVGLDQV